MKPLTKRNVWVIGTAVLAALALASCEPHPPKPKTELEKQASSEEHTTPPPPTLVKRPEPPAKP